VFFYEGCPPTQSAEALAKVGFIFNHNLKF
jgi:hypothetical protein